MTFNSPLFVPFFLIAFLAYFYAARGKTARLGVLLAANLLFYASWSVAFLPVLLGTGLLDYFVAAEIARPRQPGSPDRRKLLLGLSIAANLGVLFAFKYLDILLQGLGLVSRPLDWPVPLGISFYTFQSMSYTIDVYRGTFKPRGSLLEFLASLTFLPHLLAGPIVRSSFLIPQFESLPMPRGDNARRAAVFIALGLLKKSGADLLAPIVARSFDASAPGALDAWTGVLGFTAQMYGDFSGYSDLAIGLALLLGFQLPENFRLPYLSGSPQEYWSRWHITLSGWFRDYLFYPLALGPLRGRPYLNLFVVMVLVGVWHGPSLSFLLFGAYHGALLAAAYGLSRTRVSDWARARAARIGLTFGLIAIGQAIFRASSPAAFLRVFSAMSLLGARQPVSLKTAVPLGGVVLALFLGHWLDHQLIQKRGARLGMVASFAFATAAFAFAMLTRSEPEFIYFNY